jgi:hypothetical protein
VCCNDTCRFAGILALSRTDGFSEGTRLALRFDRQSLPRGAVLRIFPDRRQLAAAVDAALETLNPFVDDHSLFVGWWCHVRQGRF